MPQIIKHRRGSLEGLAAVTSSLAKGELIIATGSSILSPTNGDAIVFSTPENGQVQAVNKVMRGASAPPTIASSTYNGMLDGVPYYASASNVTPTLYLLKGDANEAIDLIGNIQPFSTSVDSRLDSLEASGVGSIAQINTFTASAESKFAAIQSSTSSLNTFTGSAASRLSNLELYTSSDAGIASLNSFTASQNTKNSTLATYTGSVDTKFTAVADSTSSLNTFTSSQESKNSTLATYTASLETKNSTLATYTGSVNNSITLLNASTASQQVSINALNSYTSSNDTRWTTFESVSSSFARTNAQNTFTANQVISGSLTVTQNLTILGSSSITNVSSSTLNIGTNIITVAVNQPSVRFGGISVIDSGSAGSSGSFLYDSVQDEFIFVHRGDGTNLTSSHFVLGPETYNNLGNETYLTNNRIPKGTGKEHLNDSNITDTGTLITLGSATSVTGIVTATGFSGSFEGIGSGPAFSSSVDSRLVAVETSLGGGGSIGTRVTALEAFTSSQNTKNSTLATYTGSVDTKFLSLSSVTASLLTTQTNVNNFTSSAASRLTNLESKSASVDISITNLNASSASQQVSIDALNTFSGSEINKNSTLATYTASIDTKFATLANVTSSLITSASTDSEKFTSLATYTGSINSKFTTLSTYTSSVDTKFSTLSSVTASLLTTQTSVNNFTSSTAGRLNNLESKSASVDISLSSLNGYTSSLQQAIATNASNVTIIGDLTVQGSTVTLNTTELIVEDKLITLASGSATALAADGAGILVAGANASITYENETDSFTSNKAFSGSFTGSFNTPGFGTSKRMAFRNTIGTIDFVTAPTTDGDLVQWNGTDFVMSNVIDGGSF